MNIGMFLALIGIAVIAIILLVVMAKTGRNTRHDVVANRQQIAKLETLARSQQETDRHMAVIGADSLLGRALQAQGVAGETMGDRMKKTAFSNPDSVWAAHKLRNRIAHENDIKLSQDTARRALAGFRQAMKDLGAL